MSVLKKIFKIVGISVLVLLGVIILGTAGLFFYAWKVSDVKPPKIADTSELTHQVTIVDSSFRYLDDNWMHTNRYGAYEFYVNGKPFDRGVRIGRLTREEMEYQEYAFTDQIRAMIPSEGYLKFLRYIIGFMNRDLPEHVTEEYKEEIYGTSFSVNHQFDWVGTPYARQLNYHAAHDIGHALQNMMLVGCTSFAAWGPASANGELILGRNFDFWVGDKFAERKLIGFMEPEQGHKFMYVTWGGFLGVVSGMNDQGLTVTINAAKSGIPSGAATPVSLVAREILQYAGNIEEAVAIAHRRTMFVSESFMIGSAKDKKAIVIEKTPDTLDVYEAPGDVLLCANHYQSPLLKGQDKNVEQMKESASVYRYERLQQLVQQNEGLTPVKAAQILRDRSGLNGADIGNGNEKALNQLIAHHSIIFMPEQLKVWVSTNPWQLGTYVCYDLNKVFALKGLKQSREIADTVFNIPADTFLQTKAYTDFVQFRALKHHVMQHKPVQPELLVQLNPQYYDAWRLAGDAAVQQNQRDAAMRYYQTALTKEIATVPERKSIEEKIKKLQQPKQK
jgi:hypothetical protein